MSLSGGFSIFGCANSGSTQNDRVAYVLEVQFHRWFDWIRWLDYKAISQNIYSKLNCLMKLYEDQQGVNFLFVLEYSQYFRWRPVIFVLYDSAYYQHIRLRPKTNIFSKLYDPAKLTTVSERGHVHSFPVLQFNPDDWIDRTFYIATRSLCCHCHYICERYFRNR